jgi:hypothetical protein
MSVCYACCVLSGRGLCDKLITRTEEYYRLWWVVVCNLETSWMRPRPTGGCSAMVECSVLFWTVWCWNRQTPINIYDYLIHTVCPLHVSATLVAILWEERYKGLTK